VKHALAYLSTIVEFQSHLSISKSSKVGLVAKGKYDIYVEEQGCLKNSITLQALVSLQTVEAPAPFTHEFVQNAWDPVRESLQRERCDQHPGCMTRG